MLDNYYKPTEEEICLSIDIIPVEKVIAIENIGYGDSNFVGSKYFHGRFFDYEPLQKREIVESKLS